MNSSTQKIVLAFVAAAVVVTILVLVAGKSRRAPEVVEVSIPSISRSDGPIRDQGPRVRQVPSLTTEATPTPSPRQRPPIDRVATNPDSPEEPIVQPPAPSETVGDDYETTTVLGQQYLVGPDGELLQVDGSAIAEGFNPYTAGGGPGGELIETPTGDSGNSATDRPDDDEGNSGDLFIRGLVLRGEKPIEGARIHLADAEGEGKNASSRSDGSYEFNGLAEGSYTVTLVSPAAPNARRGIALGAGESRGNEDFVLPDLPPVKGHVLGDGDVGIEEAELVVWKGTQLLGHSRSGRGGAFELFPLEPGAYTLKGTAVGHLPGEVGFTVAAQGNSQPVRLKMDASRSIRGQVLGPNNQPIRGAFVSLFGNAAWNDPFGELGIKTTDAGGFFEFAAPGGEQLQSFRAGAYGKDLVPAYSQPINIAELGPNPIVVTLGEGGTLAGIVLDDEDAPVEGVEVTISEGFQSSAAIFQRMNVPLPKTQTTRDGRFQLKAIEEGNATVSFALEGYVSVTKDIAVTAGINDLGEIRMEGGDSAKEGRLFGMVVDERSRPMVSHNVYIRNNSTNKGFAATTDTRGGFRYDELPSGTYTLFTNGSALRGDLYMTMDQTVSNLKPGGGMQYVLYDLGQSARLKVVDEGGEPIRNFRVRVRIRETGPGAATIGMDYERAFQTANGEATLDHLLAGMANFTVIVDNVGTKELEPRRIMVSANLNLGEVAIGSGASVEGVVIAEGTGGAVGGALVAAVSPEGSAGAPVNISATTDVGGNFRLKGLPARTLDLVISRAGWVTKRVTGVTIQAGESNPLGEIVMERAATLSGRVTNSDGAPVRDVQIWMGPLVIFTDREGRYFGDALPPGNATLTFRDPSGKHKETTRQVTLVAGTPGTLDVEMEKN